MAKLTDELWAQIKAAYEVKAISIRELASMYGISDTAIRKKAQSDGWIKCGSSHLIDAKLNVIKTMAEIGSQSSHLSSHHLSAIDDEVSFRIKNDASLQAIQNKIDLMVDKIDNPSHALALMTATVRHREARLGKSPDVAVQINNNGGIQSKDEFRAIAEDLLNKV